MATRGVRSKRRAMCAVQSAISTRSSAVGSMFTLVSAMKKILPCV